jgi:hypothetical protein
VIVLTLFAIVYQGWQTNKIAKAELTLSLWMQMGSLHHSLVDTADKAEFLHKLLDTTESLSGAERIRVGGVLGIAVGTHEAAFNLRSRRLIEAAAYDRCAEVTRTYLESPRVRKWWKNRRAMGSDAGFRAVIDAMTVEIESRPKNRDAGPSGQSASVPQ